MGGVLEVKSGQDSTVVDWRTRPAWSAIKAALVSPRDGTSTRLQRGGVQVTGNVLIP
jgi:hypothetical protein